MTLKCVWGSSTITKHVFILHDPKRAREAQVNGSEEKCQWDDLSVGRQPIGGPHLAAGK